MHRLTQNVTKQVRNRRSIVLLDGKLIAIVNKTLSGTKK